MLLSLIESVPETLRNVCNAAIVKITDLECILLSQLNVFVHLFLKTTQYTRKINRLENLKTGDFRD